MARKNVNCSLGSVWYKLNKQQYFLLNGDWTILLNSISLEKAILTPPVLDELSKDEMTASSSRWWRMTRRFLAMTALCGRGWAPGRRNCWVRAENEVLRGNSLLQPAYAPPPWQAKRIWEFSSLESRQDLQNQFGLARELWLPGLLQ